MSDNTDNKRLLVMRASAGSGKTYNLALQYIKHLLFDTDEGEQPVPRRREGDTHVLNAHRQLLAITFTNKATNEMKQRIVDELYNLSQPGEESDYLKEFMTESRLSEGRVRELARLALNELLFDYSNFNVSTIDSFFQGVLRNFARELDRDFNYDIQLEEDYAVQVAVHNFLLSLGHEGKPTQVDQWVKEYQRYQIREEAPSKKWEIFKDGGDILTIAKKLNTELFRGRLPAIRNYLGTTDSQGRYVSDFTKINCFKQALHEAVEKMKKEIESISQEMLGILDPLKDAMNKKQSFMSWYNKYKNDSMADMSDKMINADRNRITKQFLKDFMPSDDIIDRLHALVTDLMIWQTRRSFYRYIEDHLGELGMLAMIDKKLEEYRHESNSILIGDTNDLIGVVLDSGSEFVYERVGTLIKHFMIDEFQDTSAKQYRNFKSLLEESLGSRHFNMLIGDAKQSIYRFRNADLSVFREQVGKDFDDYIYEPDVKPEGPRSVNYRSSRNIIEFNNNLFKFVRGHYGGNSVVRTTYQDVEQGLSPHIDEKKVPGYVRILTGNYQQLLQEPVIADAARVMGCLAEGADSSVVNVTDVLPGYLLQLHERYDWGQIGILVNRNKEGRMLVESILDYNKRTTGEKINVISGESLLLGNSPVIRRIIAMLRFIDVSQYMRHDEDDDADDITQDSRLKSILRKRQSEQRIYAALNDFIQYVSTHPSDTPDQVGNALAQCLDNRPAVQAGNQQSFDDLITRLLPPDGELTTLVSIVETIIGHFKTSGDDNSNDLDRETAFLLAFMDCVQHFTSQRNGGSVREFLRYWDDNKNKLAVSLPSSTDAVNIMTIHAAKGLEFDCVLIPFADWELTDNKQERYYWMPGEYLSDVDGCDASMAANVPPLLNISKTCVNDLSTRGALKDKALEFYDKQCTDLLVENLNKTYVAFTRPRSEMHVFTCSDGKSKVEDPKADSGAKKKSSSKSSGSTLQEPAKNLTELLDVYCVAEMSLVDGIKGWFERGSMSSRDEIRAKMKKPDEDAPEQQPLNQYTIRPIALRVNVRLDNASNPGLDAGRRLHSVMSRVQDRDDLQRAVDEAYKRGVITDNPDDPCNINNVNTLVMGPVKNPASLAFAWFDPANKVYSERTITSAAPPKKDKQEEENKNGEIEIENLRPDRIVRRPDGKILVIDYKSGQCNAARIKENRSQVNGYIEKLRSIFPDATIEGRIWYVTHGSIIDENGNTLETIAGSLQD